MSSPLDTTLRVLSQVSSKLRLAITVSVLTGLTLLSGCERGNVLNVANAEGTCTAPDVLKSDLPNIQALSATAQLWHQSLDSELSHIASYCLGAAEQHAWTNVPGRRSGGIRLGDMSEAQQELAWDVLEAFLSDNGYDKAHLIATEIEEASDAGPTTDYTIAMFGNPARDGAWGFQFDGHHLALNFVVHANQVVLAPAFLGTQPLSVNGREPLQQETTVGRRLVADLSLVERQLAIGVDLIGRDVRAGSGRGQDDRGRLYDMQSFDDVGAPIRELSAESQATLAQAVDVYLGNLAEPFAAPVKLRVHDALGDGFFTFETSNRRMYYRIYVPDVLLIEYNDVSHNHIHTILRLLGNNEFSDYGIWAVNDSPRTIAEHVLLAEHHQHDEKHWH